MSPPHGGANVSARFNDALFDADVARASPLGREVLAGARARIERDGIAAHERRLCQANHASGTDLPGCFKVYVPDMAGRWRIVFQVVRFADGRLGVEYVASGVAHMPKQSRRRDVYELAHFRLHGSWPNRRT